MKIFADNRRARRDYFILETLVAGIVLQGWEVKSIRAGRVQINESYVVPNRGELFLLNSHLSPLSSASTHVETNPSRSRKLLLTAKETAYLIGKVRVAGMTLLPLNLHLVRGKIKVSVGLAKGKKQHDKRDTIKKREWQREQGRLLRGR